MVRFVTRQYDSPEMMGHPSYCVWDTEMDELAGDKGQIMIFSSQTGEIACKLANEKTQELNARNRARNCPPEIKSAWEDILEKLERGEAVLLAGSGISGIPGIHNFYPQKYYPSIKHCGFGLFEGRTEHGKFSFDGGGTMRHVQAGEGENRKSLSWTPIRAEGVVLEDLGYDFQAAIEAVRSLLLDVERYGDD